MTEVDALNVEIQKLDRFEGNEEYFKKMCKLAENILDAENHHKREEDVLFPELEKRNITGPTRIMRMEHDDLRARKRILRDTARCTGTMNFAESKNAIDEVSKYIVFHLRDHIYKENYILYPTAVDAIKDKALWEDMKNRADVIGYCGFTPGN